jgi:hypothetical protein
MPRCSSSSNLASEQVPLSWRQSSVGELKRTYMAQQQTPKEAYYSCSTYRGPVLRQTVLVTPVSTHAHAGESSR